MSRQSRPQVGQRIKCNGRVYVVTQSRDTGTVDYGHGDRAWGGYYLEAFPEIQSTKFAADMSGRHIKGIMRPFVGINEDGLFPIFEEIESHE